MVSVSFYRERIPFKQDDFKLNKKHKGLGLKRAQACSIFASIISHHKIFFL